MVAQSPLATKNWAGPAKFDPGQVKIIIDYIRREIFLMFLGDLEKFLVWNTEFTDEYMSNSAWMSWSAPPVMKEITILIENPHTTPSYTGLVLLFITKWNTSQKDQPSQTWWRHQMQRCQPFQTQIQNTSLKNTDSGFKIQNSILLLKKIQI